MSFLGTLSKTLVGGKFIELVAHTSTCIVSSTGYEGTKRWWRDEVASYGRNLENVRTCDTSCCMGRRQRPRMKGILPVRIWGVDREGQPFTEYVCTADISGAGASLAGVCAQLSVGDTIGLQYRNHQRRFRIAWIKAGSTTAERRVGVECLQPHKIHWPVSLPGEEPDEYPPPDMRFNKHQNRYSNRRRQVRYPVTGRVYLSLISGGTGVWTKLGDLSLTGCYLQAGEPLQIGRRVALFMKIGYTELETTGVVRVCYPGMAMGVEFMFMSNADRRVLTGLIAQLQKSDRLPRDLPSTRSGGGSECKSTALPAG